MNMLHLMPPLTSMDCGYRLKGPEDMIDVFDSLEESLDSRGSPVRSRLWHLIVTHTGYDLLNPQMGTYWEVVDDQGFALFLEDLETNARGPRGFECPPREYMHGRKVLGTVLVLATDTEHTQMHPWFFCELS